MKNFEKPLCEIVHFTSRIIATSVCGCWDGEDDWGTVCKRDTPACECTVNYNPAIANCIPCSSYEGG